MGNLKDGTLRRASLMTSVHANSKRQPGIPAVPGASGLKKNMRARESQRGANRIEESMYDRMGVSRGFWQRFERDA